MKKITMVIIIVIMVLMGVGTVLAAPQPSNSTIQSGEIGVINVDTIMKQSPKVKAFQDELNQKGKELSDQLETEKSNLSQEEFKQHQNASYNEFLKIKQDFEAKIDLSIKQALAEVAQEKKLKIILYKNSVAFGGLDVTLDVIAKMK